MSNCARAAVIADDLTSSDTGSTSLSESRTACSSFSGPRARSFCCRMPTPATPLGGNTGTTVGEQRLIAFQRAADIWGSLLDSGVEIRIQASFTPLTCDATSATLGSAGPIQVLGDGPVLQVFFTDQRPMHNHRDYMRADKKKAVAFAHALIRLGVYCTPGGKLYLSLAHTDQDIDRTIEIDIGDLGSDPVATPTDQVGGP